MALEWQSLGAPRLHIVDLDGAAKGELNNLDIIKVADYIIDLGPEGGDAGGEVIAAGLPKEICSTKGSYTGEYLKSYVRQNHSK